MSSLPEFGTCPDCGGEMETRKGKTGLRLVCPFCKRAMSAAEWYSECYTLSVEPEEPDPEELPLSPYPGAWGPEI